MTPFTIMLAEFLLLDSAILSSAKFVSLSFQDQSKNTSPVELKAEISTRYLGLFKTMNQKAKTGLLY